MSTGSFFDTGESIASISWKNARKGTRLEGIQDRPDEQSQQTTMARPGEPSKPKFFKRPDGSDDPNAPMMQGIITLQTEWRAFEGTSAAFRAKAQEAGLADDGKRRVFINGSLKQPTTNKAARDALKVAGIKPGVGCRWVFEVTDVTESTTGGADIKSFRAEVSAPTPETLAAVGAGQTDVGPQPDEEPDDPWARDAAVRPAAGGTKGTDYDENPPF